MSQVSDEQQGWTMERKLLVATFLCSAIGFGFSIGFNWAKLTTQGVKIDKLEYFAETTLPKDYVRRDVYELQQKQLSDAINELTDTLREMQRSGR